MLHRNKSKFIRKIPFLIPSFLILLIAVSFPATGQTRTFTSKKGGFSGNFPGHPKESQTVHKKFVGKIIETTFRVETRNGNYSVTYTDLPGIAATFGSSKKIMKDAKNALLKEVNGKEISFIKTSLEGNPGRILEFVIPKKGREKEMVGSARFYLVENRLFVLVATRTKGLTLTPLNRFLNSFELLKS